MKKLGCAAPITMLPEGSAKGMCHTKSILVCTLRFIPYMTGRTGHHRVPSSLSATSGRKKLLHSPLYLQCQWVTSQATPSLAESRKEQRNPSELAFEEALYMDFAHPSVSGTSDTFQLAASADAAVESPVAVVAPHTEEFTSHSSTAAMKVSQVRDQTSVTGSPDLSIRVVEGSAPLLSPVHGPRDREGAIGSSSSRFPLFDTEEERRAHHDAERAFEEAINSDMTTTSNVDGGAVGSCSRNGTGSTSNTPTTLFSEGETRGNMDAKGGCISACIHVTPPQFSSRLSATQSLLPQLNEKLLSKGASEPPQAPMGGHAEVDEPMPGAPAAPTHTLFVCAEAAFERALYDGVTVGQLTEKVEGIVSSDQRAHEVGEHRGVSPCASSKLSTTPASLGMPASASSNLDRDADGACLGSAHDIAPRLAFQGLPASTATAAEVKQSQQAPPDDCESVDSIACPKAPDTADRGSTDRVVAREGTPPPTVSMHCALNLDNCDTPIEKFALSDVLFHVAEHHNSVITHIEPRDRVRRCMPLLDRVSKQEIFFVSEWISHLEKAEGADAAVHRPKGAEGSVGSSMLRPFTHREVVGRCKVLRSLVFRFLRMPHLWWDQVQEVVLLAAEKAATLPTSFPGAVEAPAASEDAVSPPPGCVGKGGAGLGEVSAGDPASLSCVARGTTAECVGAAMTRIFGTDPQEVHLFSDALCEALIALDDDTIRIRSDPEKNISAFEGPLGAWNAFVLTQRNSATGVCGPHRPPFSFGEGQPTVNVSDLAPLLYCDAAASWLDTVYEEPPHSAAAATGHSPAVSTLDGGSGGSDSPVEKVFSVQAPLDETAAAAGAITTEWDNMNEEEQNTLLFGAESARLSQRVRESGGIYAVYGQNNVSFEMESLLSDAEAAATAAESGEIQKEEEPHSDAADAAQSHTPAKTSPLETLRAQEARRVSEYDVDRVVLCLTNSEGVGVPAFPGGRTTFLSNLAAEFSAGSGGSSGQRGGRGRMGTLKGSFQRPFLQQLLNKEDVQLAALWERFVLTSTGDLINNLIYVRRHATSLVHDAVVDVAVQRAFWLLFFARDEVRAVTHPRQTYATLWILHHRLVSMFTSPRRAGSPASSSPVQSCSEGESGKTAHIPFEALSLHSQVSYTCFGCAHVPMSPNESMMLPTSSSVAGEATGVDEKPSSYSSDDKPYLSPADLYAAFARSYSVRGVERKVGEVIPLTQGEGRRVNDGESVTFESLSPLQKFSIAFCFPLSSSGTQEISLSSSVHDGTTAAAVHTVSGGRTGNAEENPEEFQATPWSGARSSSQSEEELSSNYSAAESAVKVLEPKSFSEKVAGHLSSSTDDEALMQRVQSALEACVYGCLSSLRTVGALVDSLPSMDCTGGGSRSVSAALSDVQRRKVQRAVRCIAAVVTKKSPVSSPADASVLSRELRVSCKAEGEHHQMPASPRRRGRKPKNADKQTVSIAL